MERYTYFEIIEGVEEDFEAGYKLGDNDVQATFRLLDDFYRDLIRDNPIEALMFYTAICSYLLRLGKKIDHIILQIRDCYSKLSIDDFRSELSSSEADRLLMDFEKVEVAIGMKGQP